MKQNQISGLKKRLSFLYGNYRELNIIGETEEDFEELERTTKEIDSIKCKLFELTGDYKYASVYEKVKKYRRPYWDLRDYGAISLSELYKRKLAKIEIIKRLHKQNGVADSTVNMENIHGYYVAKEEIEAYIKNRRNKMKQLNRRKRQFDMLINEMWAYAFYFNTKNRMEEVRQLVRQVFGPNKRAMDAKLNDIRKVIKLTKMLRDQL